MEAATAEIIVFAEIEQAEVNLTAEGLPKFFDEVSHRIASHQGVQENG